MGKTNIGISNPNILLVAQTGNKAKATWQGNYLHRKGARTHLHLVFIPTRVVIELFPHWLGSDLTAFSLASFKRIGTKEMKERGVETAAQSPHSPRMHRDIFIHSFTRWERFMNIGSWQASSL